MKIVENAGIKGLKRKRKPYQVTPADFFHESDTLRMLFAELIHCQDKNRIVIIPSVSYGMANAAANLKKKGKILVAADQFPSNVYPWMSLRDHEVEILKPAKDNSELSQLIIEAIDEQTAAVAIGHVHWVDGTLYDLKSIREKTKMHGAALIIDGTQSVGALPFDVSQVQPDALICAGYKWLMGPYSIGLAYYGPYFDDGHPIEQNWINRLHSDDFGALVNYRMEYQPRALRYEVGERSNFVLVPMMIAAIKQLLKWGPENIQGYCQSLTAPYYEKLTSLGYIMANERQRAAHMSGIRLPEGLSMEQVKKQLAIQHVSVSIRGNAVRVSPHLYNHAKDMQRLYQALKLSIL